MVKRSGHRTRVKTKSWAKAALLARMRRPRFQWLTPRRIATAVAALVLLGYLLVVFLAFEPRQHWLVQRGLGLICAALALTVYLVATRRTPLAHELMGRIQRGQHADFGKRLRAKRVEQRRAIPLPGGRKIELRPLGAAAVFLLTFLWWLTPAAPIGIAERELEDLTDSLGEQIIATQLVSPDGRLVFWQPPLVLGESREVAARIDEDANAYYRALRAIVEGNHDEARRLLALAMREGSAEPARINLARAQNALFAARFDEAVAHYRDAVASHPDDVSLIAQATVAWLQAGNLREAQLMAARAMAAAHAPPQESPALGIALYLKGLTTVARGGDLAEAERFFARAPRVWKESLPPNHPLAASSRNNQGMVFLLLARFSAAREMVNWARDNWQRRLGAGSPLVATALDNQAMLQIRQARFDEARAQLEAAEAALGPPKATTRLIHAMHLANVGAFAEARGDYGDAIQAAERAYATLEKTLGDRHVLLAGPLMLLGDVQFGQALYTKSEAYYFRALRLVRETCGPGHPYAALIELSLARINLARGHLDTADDFLNRAVDVLDEVLAADHPDRAELLALRGLILRERGQRDQAREMLEQALRIRLEAFGEGHPAASFDRAALASLEVEPENLDRGLQGYEQAIDQLSASLGPNHPEVARLLFEQAQLHLRHGRHAEAAEPLKQCFRIRKERLPDFHPDRAATLLAYADVLEHADPPARERAAGLRQRAEAIMQRHLEQDRVDRTR